MAAMSDVWDRTVEYLNDHLGTILPIAIFAIFVPTSITGALGGVTNAAAGPARLLLGLLSLGFVILQIWGQLGITAQVIDPAIGGRAGSVAARRLPVALLTLLVLFLGVAASLVPFFSLIAAGGVDMTAMAAGRMDLSVMSQGIRWALIGYVVMMIVIFVVFASRLVPMLPVVVAEREGVQSIGRAFSLTRGLTWRLIGIVILYAIVTTVAVMATQSVFGLLLGLIAGGDGPVTLASVITAVLVAAVQTIFTVLATVFAAKLYLATARPPAGAPLTGVA